MLRVIHAYLDLKTLKIIEADPLVTVVGVRNFLLVVEDFNGAWLFEELADLMEINRRQRIKNEMLQLF